MKTCLKVGLLVLAAVLLAAGAALACDNPSCNTPGIDQDKVSARPADPAPAGQPGTQLECLGNDCLTPGLNDERLAAQTADAVQRLIMVCIAETCGLTPDLASIMLTCYNANCFAPENQAEQTAVR
jgi:hypothetical protein